MTKLIPLSFLLVYISSVSYGQIKKGSILLGGQVFYYNSKIVNSTSQRDQKNNSAAYDISVGKVVKENSLVGLSVSYSPSAYDFAYNGSTYLNSRLKFYSIGGYYRLYKSLGKDFYFFSEMGAAYVFSHQIDTDTLGIKQRTVNQTGGQLNLSPGISYKIFKRLNLEITIPNIVYVQYSVSKTETTNPVQNSKENRFSLNSNLNSSPINYLGIGFRIIL